MSIQPLDAISKVSHDHRIIKNSVISLKIVTLTCASVLRIQNFSSASAASTWPDELNSKFQGAKDKANNWVQNLSVDIVSHVPSQLVNYATTFEAAVEQILDLCKQNPNASGKRDPVITQINEMLQVLSSQMSDIQDQTSKTSKNLIQWVSAAKQLFVDINSFIKHVQQQDKSNQANILVANIGFKEIEDFFAQYNESIIDITLSNDKGLLLLEADLTAGNVATLHSAVSSKIIGAGLSDDISKFITFALIQDRVDKAFNSIYDNVLTKTPEDLSITFLSGSSLVGNSLCRFADFAQKCFADYVQFWMAESESVTQMIDKFNASSSVKDIDDRVVSLQEIQRWKEIMNFSTAISTAKISSDYKAIYVTAIEDELYDTL